MLATNKIIFDPSGHETLDVISRANRFNHWVFSSIEPFCRGKILEIGSGVGNISAFFISENANIYLSDINPEYCRILRHSFPIDSSKVLSIDLVDPDFDSRFSCLFNTFDCVFALNVLEHISDHNKALQNAFKLLNPSGKLIVLVPAYSFLYCGLDLELGHCRRYSRKLLSEVMLRNGYTIEKLFSFNVAGIGGWLLFGKLFRRKLIESGEMGLFNKLVPAFKWIDKIVFKKIGLSLVVVATKTGL